MPSDATIVPTDSPPEGRRGGRRGDRSVSSALLPTVSALRWASLSAETSVQYRRAVQQWLVYCGDGPRHYHRPLVHRSGGRDMDECLCMYLASIYRQHGGRLRYRAVNTLYGVYALWPHVRHQLTSSEQLVAGWGRLRPSLSHPPLTWPLVTLIAVTMCLNGYTDGGLATLVAFDALLRVSEMASLRVCDVSAPTDPRRGRTTMPVTSATPSAATSRRVLLRLAVTKTGSNQWVELTHPAVERLLLLHVQGRPQRSRVFQLSLPSHRSTATGAYRHALHVVCRGLGLEGHHFTPHSLRHGGATHALQHLGQSVETVMLRGRWRSNSSCRTYLQAGRAQLLQLAIAPAVLLLADTVAEDWYDTLLTAVEALQ
jgi:integrase